MSDCGTEKNYNKDMIKVIDETFEKDKFMTFLDACNADSQKILEKHLGWDTIYHFSRERANIIAWLNLDKDDKVLEIGAECGAITVELAREVRSIDAVERNSAKIEVLERRCALLGLGENVKVISGDYISYIDSTEKKYDVILVTNIDGLGYEKTAITLLIEKLNHKLTSDGKLIIAYDNRLGLKYLAGAKYLSKKSLFENADKKTASPQFTKKSFDKLLSSLKINEYTYYYPYPDYRFMSSLYSEERLPRVGELVDNSKALDGDRHVFFDEKEAYDSLISDDQFEEFANSYIVIIGSKPKTAYAKFSLERSPEYALITLQESNADKKHFDGEWIIKKQPLFKEGEAHIRKLADSYQKLNERYRGTDLSINACKLVEDETGLSAVFEYISGETLTEKLDYNLLNGNQHEFDSLFSKYCALVEYNEAAGIFDRDIIFDNILISDDKWTLIDYEWSYTTKIESKETEYRAIHTYLTTDPKRGILNPDLANCLLPKLAVDVPSMDKREEEFQNSVKGKHISLNDINRMLDNKRVIPIDMEIDHSHMVQIYSAGSDGIFSENRSFLLNDAFSPLGEVNLNLEVSSECCYLRIDPLMTSCLVEIKKITIDGVNKDIRNRGLIITNGYSTKNGIFLFDTEDPNIVIKLGTGGKSENRKVSVKMLVSILPKDIIKKLALRLKRF